MAASPTQRSLKLLRDEGYMAAVVEHFNPHVKIRQDLFGFVDVVGLRENEVLFVQTTSASNISSRVNKIVEHENFYAVRDAGVRIEVHGWQKKGRRWHCKRLDIS